MKHSAFHTQDKVKVGNLNLYYEAFGDPSHPTVLLINGLSCQCLQWFPYFYQPIVDRGYCVIRFDNRDIGFSSWIDPEDWEKQPDSLNDMAAGLLQALRIVQSHVIGVLMGGAIAQRIAIEYPRILSLTSIVSFANPADIRMGIAPFLRPKVSSIQGYLGFWSVLAAITFPLQIPLYSEL